MFQNVCSCANNAPFHKSIHICRTLTFFLYFQWEMTVLHYGAESGHDLVVEGLIRGGADVNAVNKVSWYA